MSDYTKITDFSAKDPLASGDPEKLAVGADVDAEFDAIATMSATKEDKANKNAANGYCPLDGAADVPDANLSSDVMRLDTPQTVTSGKGDAFVTLTDDTSIAIDCDDGNTFVVTITANRAIANPSNPRDGQTITLLIIQDGVGSHTLTWGSAWKWPSATPPTLSTGAGDIDMITAKYRSSTTSWYAVTSGLDFA